MVKTIKDIVTDSFWIMPATPNFVDNGIPYITSKNIKVGKIDFSKVQYISENDYNEISKNRPIMSNDLLISMIGTLGNIAIVREEDKPFYGQNMFLLRLNSDIVDLRYFYNFFNSDCINSYLQSKKNKSTQGYLKANHIEGLEIPIVSLQEQKRIACELDRVTNLINKRKEQLLKLDEIVKARFVELFTPFFSQQKFLLGDLCETITKGTTPTTLGFDFVDAGVNFIKIENISANEKIDATKMLHISEECNVKLKRSILKENDILFSIAGTKMGITAKVTSDVLPANTNQALAIIRLKKEVSMNVDFLIELLHADMIVEQIESMKSTVAQTNLSLDNVRNFNVIVPPIELQNQFAAFVKQTDKSKLEVQKSLEKLELLKKALMQKYFG